MTLIIELLKNEIIFIFCILFLLWLGWKIRKVWLNIIFFFSKRKGRKGEYKAIKLLEKAGYEILDKQNKLTGKFKFNNQLLEYFVKPDFLVKKDNVKYFVEVKTGNAAEIKNISTRRQLLEYSYLADFSTIILIDMQKKKIVKVNFKDI